MKHLTLIATTALLFAGAACSDTSTDEQEGSSDSGITLEVDNARAVQHDGADVLAFDVSMTNDVPLGFVDFEITCDNSTEPGKWFGHSTFYVAGQFEAGSNAGELIVSPPAGCEAPAQLVLQPADNDNVILETFTFPIEDALLG
jgi:hypothetical protein